MTMLVAATHSIPKQSSKGLTYGYHKSYAVYLNSISGRPQRKEAMTRRNRKIEVKGKEIGVTSDGKEAFICLTDIARYKNSEATGLVISHWLSTRYTIEFMGLWEKIHIPDFNVTEFRNIKNESDSTGLPGQYGNLNAVLINEGLPQHEPDCYFTNEVVRKR